QIVEPSWGALCHRMASPVRVGDQRGSVTDSLGLDCGADMRRMGDPWGLPDDHDHRLPAPRVACCSAACSGDDPSRGGYSTLSQFDRRLSCFGGAWTVTLEH